MRDEPAAWAPYDGAPPAKRFEIIPFGRIAFSTAPAYLVKGILPRVGLAVMWGPPKCGKSFLAFDLTMHVALGWSYRDRRVQQGAVVYCALEGAEGFKARVEAFRQHKMADGAADVPFFLAPTPLNLVADHPALIASIRGELGGLSPGCIVIDTVNRSLAGSESDDRDMGAYIKAADALREAFGCLVLVVHHSGVDASRPRGHTSLAGAVDAQIAVKKDGDSVVATLERCKDGPEGTSIASRLVWVEIGTDDDGDAITSCVVDEAEVASKAPAGKGPKLPDRVRLGLDVLLECALSGEALPAAYEIPGNPLAVPIAVWRDAMFSRGVLDRDAKNPREDFRRVKCALLAKRLAGERDGLVWPVTK